MQARDGVCSEGRPGLNGTAQQQPQQLAEGVTAVDCDLGTDCDDW
jgi:hypothetical protein